MSKCNDENDALEFATLAASLIFKDKLESEFFKNISCSYDNSLFKLMKYTNNSDKFSNFSSQIDEDIWRSLSIPNKLMSPQNHCNKSSDNKKVIPPPHKHFHWLPILIE